MVYLLAFVFLAWSCGSQESRLPAQQLSVFPAEMAEWQISGEVTADAALAGASLAESDSYRYPGECIDYRGVSVTERNLLPNVLVMVEGLENKWRFGAPSIKAPLRTIEITDSGVRPATVYAQVGDRLRLRSVVEKVRIVTDGQMFWDHPAQVFFTFSGNTLNAGPVLWNSKFDNLGGLSLRKLELIGPWRGYLNSGDSITWKVKDSGVFSFSMFAGKYRLRLVNHSIFTMSNDKGQFALPRLPNGRYRVVAIHDLLGRVLQSIEINDREPAPLHFRFEVPNRLRSNKGVGR